MTGQGRKSYNEELYGPYFFIRYYGDDNIKDDEMGRTCSTKREKGNAYKVFVGKSERNRLLGRPRHRWEMEQML
jgi:hypothetical protein